MSVKYEDLQGLHEDTTPNEEPRANRFIPQGMLMNKWIPSPLSRLNCSPLNLLLGLLITIFFFTVIITQVRVTREVTEVKTSVNRILSDEVAGVLTNGLQKILAMFRASENRTYEALDESGPCGEGWNHKNDSCYYMGWHPQTWMYAKKSCEDRHSHLVVITSKEEMAFIREFTYTGTVWIGLVSEGGAWRWVDGTSYEKNPTFWWKGQPDNWFGHGLEGGEDCAQVTDGDGWMDAHCTLSFPYICEKEIS